MNEGVARLSQREKFESSAAPAELAAWRGAASLCVAEPSSTFALTRLVASGRGDWLSAETFWRDTKLATREAMRKGGSERSQWQTRRPNALLTDPLDRLVGDPMRIHPGPARSS